MSRAVLFALCLGSAQAQDDATLVFSNKASNGVTLMNGCDSSTYGHFAQGEEKTLSLPKGMTKLWIRPDGFDYQCNLDCLDCFYIAADHAANGVLVTGIGYGHNTPVKVHDGVGHAVFTATDQRGVHQEVTCAQATCDFNHIIQAQKGTATLTISGDVAANAPEATLDFSNTSPTGVTLKRASDCTSSASLGYFKQGEGATLKLSGSTKIWVRPDGCTEDDGCLACNLDCLGCFYIGANVAANGVMVAGIGYGQNQPVKVHQHVAKAVFTATDQTSTPIEVDCSTDSCNFNHIIQAKSGTAKLIISGDEVKNTGSAMVV